MFFDARYARAVDNPGFGRQDSACDLFLLTRKEEGSAATAVKHPFFFSLSHDVTLLAKSRLLVETLKINKYVTVTEF